MKPFTLFFFVCVFITFSCTTTVPGISCELDDQTLVVEPFCSFNPKFYTDVAFPVRALLDNEDASSDEFTFKWSSDPDFGGSAISISYDLLPLEVEITEIATDCTKTAVLEKSYWD